MKVLLISLGVGACATLLIIGIWWILCDVLARIEWRGRD